MANNPTVLDGALGGSGDAASPAVWSSTGSRNSLRRGASRGASRGSSHGSRRSPNRRIAIGGSCGGVADTAFPKRPSSQGDIGISLDRRYNRTDGVEHIAENVTSVQRPRTVPAPTTGVPQWESGCATWPPFIDPKITGDQCEHSAIPSAQVAEEEPQEEEDEKDSLVVPDGQSGCCMDGEMVLEQHFPAAMPEGQDGEDTAAVPYDEGSNRNPRIMRRRGSGEELIAPVATAVPYDEGSSSTAKLEALREQVSLSRKMSEELRESYVRPGEYRCGGIMPQHTNVHIWCGRCGSLAANASRNRFPKPHKVRELHLSLEQIKKKPDLPEKLSHWVEDVGDIRIPELRWPSAFSRQPHMTFKFLEVRDVSKLELHVLQHKVKVPMMKLQLAEEDAEVDDGASGLSDDSSVCSNSVDDRSSSVIATRALSAVKNVRQRRKKKELEIGMLRVIVRKPLEERTPADIDVLVNFLEKWALFKNTSTDFLNDVSVILELRRYQEGDTIYNEATSLEGFHLLVKGKASLQAGPYTVLKGAAETQGAFVVRSAGSCLEDRELFGPRANAAFVNKRLFWRGWEGMRFLWSAIAKQDIESIYLPSLKLADLFHKHLLQERFTAMQSFPSLRYRAPTYFQQPSRVVREGRKVTLHNLFEVKEIPRHHTFFQVGEKLSADSAQIMMIISGTVDLKARGAVVESLVAGSLLGEDALWGDPYQTTAICTSGDTKVLAICVADYLAQFLQGKTLRGKPKDKSIRGVTFATSPGAGSDAELGESDDPRPPDAPPPLRVPEPSILALRTRSYQAAAMNVRRLMEDLKRPAKATADLQSIFQQEWRLIGEKNLPRCVAPADARAAARSRSEGPSREVSSRQIPHDRRLTTQSDWGATTTSSLNRSSSAQLSRPSKELRDPPPGIAEIPCAVTVLPATRFSTVIHNHSDKSCNSSPKVDSDPLEFSKVPKSQAHLQADLVAMPTPPIGPMIGAARRRKVLGSREASQKQPTAGTPREDAALHIMHATRNIQSSKSGEDAEHASSSARGRSIREALVNRTIGAIHEVARAEPARSTQAEVLREPSSIVGPQDAAPRVLPVIAGPPEAAPGVSPEAAPRVLPEAVGDGGSDHEIIVSPEEGAPREKEPEAVTEATPEVAVESG